ncbi:MAG: LexA family transcriptional regulator [Clostridia bacterium]|nr:LexA family transcriptional regulator [Clostridia bacterium]
MPRSRPEADTARREYMAKIIRQKRLEAGLEQAELAARIGVTAAAVGNWERCIARPDLDTLPRLCRELNVSISELLGTEPEMTLCGHERAVLEGYRRLKPLQQQMIRNLIEQMEWNDLREAKQRVRSAYVRRIEMEQAAAAGFGGPMEDEASAETVYVRANPLSEKCTRIVKVNGQSMEPVYEDGSRVYVDENQPPRLGDDVVVIYEGTLYIKRFEKSGLVSYNPDRQAYPVIKVNGWQNVKYVGKVVGRVSDYDIASGRELQEVEDAFSPDYD